MDRLKDGIVDCLVLAELFCVINKPLKVWTLAVIEHLVKVLNALLHHLWFDIRLGIKNDFQCPASGHGVVLVEIVRHHSEDNLGVPISEIVLLEEGEDFSEVLVVACEFTQDGQFDHVGKYNVRSGDVKEYMPQEHHLLEPHLVHSKSCSLDLLQESLPLFLSVQLD